MRRMPLPSLPMTTFGVHGPFTVVVFCFGLIAASGSWYPGMLMFWRWETVPGMILNLWLLGAVGLAFAVWAFSVGRAWITAATGAGFPLAAYGITIRIVTYGLEALLPDWAREALPDEPVFAALDLTRDLGLASYATGLGFVAFASVHEFLQKRRVPDWVIH